LYRGTELLVVVVIVVKGVYLRKKSVLIVLVILAIGLVGTGLSAFYMQNEYSADTTVTKFTDKISHGFPLGWYGHSDTWGGIPFSATYWFSLESLLLDAAFWVAISFFVSFGAIKSVNRLHKTRASKNLSVIKIWS
jgi:hypothetical protein